MKNTWTGTLFSAQADGPALTAAAAASMLPASNNMKRAIGPEYFDTVGREFRFEASGRCSTVITSPGTLRFDLRLGGTVIWDSGAIALDTTAAKTNMPWRLRVDLTLRAIGTNANFMGSGELLWEGVAGSPTGGAKGVAPAVLPWNTAPVVGGNVDLSVAQTFDAFFTQTVATGSLTLHQARLVSLD